MDVHYVSAMRSRHFSCLYTHRPHAIVVEHAACPRTARIKQQPSEPHVRELVHRSSSFWHVRACCANGYGAATFAF